MGLIADQLAEDLGDIDPQETAEHFRAIASLTKQQMSGMLGWAQQERDHAVYSLAYILADSAIYSLLADWLDGNAGGCTREPVPF